MEGYINSPDTVKELNQNYPDKVLPLHLLKGLPIWGNITYNSGVYRKVEPEENEEDFNKHFEHYNYTYVTHAKGIKWGNLDTVITRKVVQQTITQECVKA